MGLFLFSWRTGASIKNEGMIDLSEYILAQHLQASFRQLQMKQDHNPKHKYKSVKKWLLMISVVVLPCHSPDLEPSEKPMEILEVCSGELLTIP